MQGRSVDGTSNIPLSVIFWTRRLVMQFTPPLSPIMLSVFVVGDEIDDIEFLLIP